MLHNCHNEKVTCNFKSLPSNDGIMRIYALMLNGEVLYIGQSVNMKARIYEHDHGKRVFDSVAFAECSREGANDVEAYNIVRFHPKMNGELPANSLFISSRKASELVIKSMASMAAFSPIGKGVFYVGVDDVEKAIASNNKIVNQVTSNKLATLKESINAEREKIGEKLLTTPDIIESIVDIFNSQRNEKMGVRKL